MQENEEGAEEVSATFVWIENESMLRSGMDRVYLIFKIIKLKSDFSVLVKTSNHNITL